MWCALRRTSLRGEIVCFLLCDASKSLNFIRELLQQHIKIFKELWYNFKHRDRQVFERCKRDKGEEVALSVLLRICEYLDCDIGDI